MVKLLDRFGLNDFRGRLFLVFSIGSLILVASLTALWLYQAWIAMDRTVERDMQIIADRTAGEVEQYMAGKTAQIVTARELLSYPGEDGSKLALMLKRLVVEFDQFKNLVLIDPSGRVIASSNGDKAITIPQEGLSTAIAGNVYRTGILLTGNNLPYIKIVVPLFWQGEVFRVLVADIDILPVWERIDSIRFGNTGRASIISMADGSFLADADKEKVLKRFNWKEFSGGVDFGRGSISFKDPKGTVFEGASVEIPSAGWRLIVFQERHEALQFVRRMIFLAVLVVIISIISSFLVSSRLAARISKPVEELHNAAIEVGRENLEYTVPPLRGREMQSLGETFNSMIGSLKEKHKTEQRLAQAEKMAAVGRLAADVAHEINNPLAVMKNFIFILQTKKMSPDDPNQEQLKVIINEIDRIAAIIRAFNDFYKGTHLAIEAKEVEILEPLNEVISLCTDDLAGKEIILDTKSLSGGAVMADKDRLKQVFLNLVKNAQEAMPNGGVLRLSSMAGGGRLLIDVSDTGVGISDEDMKKIFDPFFSTKGVKGTGLGLSVSYSIIVGFKGTIDVMRNEGGGTTFRVSLPLAETTETGRPEKNPPQSLLSP